MEQKLGTGIVHRLPTDMRHTLLRHSNIADVWNTLTPIARNEWICYVTLVKKKETRAEHLVRLVADLGHGKRRPCCWPGCPHRRPNAAKWFSARKK